LASVELDSMRIEDIRNGMRSIHIEGKIVDMNQFMLVLEDETGRMFVRYNYRNLVKPVQKGDYVKVDNGVAVNYSGILQVKLPRNGQVTSTQVTST
jgi:RNase P/RNase MRP subunit p29